MKLMIVGHARHGKDTVAEILARFYGLKFTSSSWYCAERIMMPFFSGFGNHFSSVQECFDKRGEYRSIWFDQICKYCEGDRARLVREILAENDVYVGCRQHREFMTAKNEGLFDASIWVDATARGLPPEPSTSMTVEPWMCDYWLDNSGTLEELERNVASLMENKILPNGPYGSPISRLRELARQPMFVWSPRLLKPSERVPIGNSRPAALESLSQADGHSETSFGSFPPKSGGRP